MNGPHEIVLGDPRVLPTLNGCTGLPYRESDPLLKMFRKVVHVDGVNHVLTVVRQDDGAVAVKVDRVLVEHVADGERHRANVHVPYGPELRAAADEGIKAVT